MRHPVYLISSDPINPVWFGSMQCQTGELDGQPAWTNGAVMFVGPPPVESVPSKYNWQTGIERADPGNMPEIHPIAISRQGSQRVVWFSDGKTVMDAKYFAAAQFHFPHSCSYSDGDGSHAVVLKDNGKRVALIMRLKYEQPWPANVQDVLQRANAEPSQPANQIPVEPQPKEVTE